jgi:hypothetical protein
METFQTDLYHLPLRHWSEIKRFLQEWAQVHYLCFRNYTPYTHVIEPIGNPPVPDYPYYCLILQRGRQTKFLRHDAIVWIHKDSVLLSSR